MKKLFELARGKQDFASIQIITDSFSIDLIYEELDVQEDRERIYMGAKRNENYDIEIIKEHIHNVELVSDNLIDITLDDGNTFRINIESDCSSNPIE